MGTCRTELRAYSSDFDDGGRWVNVPEYGYCWTPTVVLASRLGPVPPREVGVEGRRLRLGGL